MLRPPAGDPHHRHRLTGFLSFLGLATLILLRWSW